MKINTKKESNNQKSKQTEKKKKKPAGTSKKDASVMPEKIPFYKNIFFYAFVLFMIWILIGTEPFATTSEIVPLNEVIQLLKEEKVQNVVVTGDSIEVQLRNGTKIATKKETSVSFSEVLTNHNIDISKIPGEYTVEQPPLWMELIPTILSFEHSPERLNKSMFPFFRFAQFGYMILSQNSSIQDNIRFCWCYLWLFPSCRK